MICTRCSHSFNAYEMEHGLYKAVCDVFVCLTCIKGILEGWLLAARAIHLEKPEGFVQ